MSAFKKQIQLVRLWMGLTALPALATMSPHMKRLMGEAACKHGRKCSPASLWSVRCCTLTIFHDSLLQQGHQRTRWALWYSAGRPLCSGKALLRNKSQRWGEREGGLSETWCNLALGDRKWISWKDFHRCFVFFLFLSEELSFPSNYVSRPSQGGNAKKLSTASSSSPDRKSRHLLLFRSVVSLN